MRIDLPLANLLLFLKVITLLDMAIISVSQQFFIQKIQAMNHKTRFATFTLDWAMSDRWAYSHARKQKIEDSPVHVLGLFQEEQMGCIGVNYQTSTGNLLGQLLGQGQGHDPVLSPGHD